MNRRCVIAAVDLDRHAEGVVRRALHLARMIEGPLVVTHVVDYDTGFESDHAPFATPRQLQAEMARTARAWLVGLLHHMNHPEVEIMVSTGRPAEVLAALAAERRARFLVTGASAWGRLGKLADLARDPRVSGCRCDVLHAASDAPGLGRRVTELAGRLLFGEAR